MTPNIRFLALAGFGLALLAGLVWSENNGYRRAMAECEANAAEQQRKVDVTIRDVETRWRTEAERLAARNTELENEVAAIDRAVEQRAGSDRICLAGDSVRALRSLR
jgi:hypothetical protein